MRGILLPLQILEIVDFGILVAAEIWRIVRFLLYIYSCSNIFMETTPFRNIISMIDILIQRRMKMKKKFIMLLLVLVMAMPTMACGEKENKKDTIANQDNKSIEDNTSEEEIQEDALLSFGFTAEEFIEDLSNFASFSGTYIDDVNEVISNTWVVHIGVPNEEAIDIHLLCNSDEKVANINVRNITSSKFLDTAKAVFSATDFHLDSEELFETLNLSTPPTILEDSQLITRNGITIMFTPDSLAIQRDDKNPSEYEYIEIHSNSKGEAEAIKNAESSSESTVSSDSNIKDNEIPAEYRSALKKAKSYSDSMHMSKAGIYNQLTSEYGEKFSAEAAQYAIDNMEANWNANALKKAESYSDTMYMSKAGIYDQLTSEHGEKFTAEEAQYAIDNIKADWNANALEKAKTYQNEMSMSPEAIRDQLTSEHGEKFTQKEADYAIANLN